MHLVGYGLLTLLGTSVALYLWSSTENTAVVHGEKSATPPDEWPLVAMLATTVLGACVLLRMTTPMPSRCWWQTGS